MESRSQGGRQSLGTSKALSRPPTRASCPPPRATIAPPRRPKSRASGRAMPRGGAQKKRSSFDNPTLLEESRTRSEPERRREADEGERPVRGMGGRLPRRRGRVGYSSPRRGARPAAAEG